MLVITLTRCLHACRGTPSRILCLMTRSGRGLVYGSLGVLFLAAAGRLESQQFPAVRLAHPVGVVHTPPVPQVGVPPLLDVTRVSEDATFSGRAAVARRVGWTDLVRQTPGRRSRAHVAAVGAAVGAVGGIAFGLSRCESSEGSHFPCPLAAVRWAIPGAAVGAVVALLVTPR